MRKYTSFFIAIVMIFSMLIFPTVTDASSLLEKTVKSNVGSSPASVTLRSAKTGKIIFNHKGDIARQPASNMKLLSGATALSILGEDYRFSTDLYIDGDIDESTLNGNVYLKGSGDPTLLYKDLKSIASKLTEYGVEKVNGDVYLDDTVFTGSTLPPGSTPSEETYYYAARTSALNMSPNEDFDAGSVIVEVTGATAGKVPTVKVIPHTSGQQIIINASTGKSGSSTSISVKRKTNTNQIVISGNIAPGKSTKAWVTVQDPTLATGHAFVGALEEKGIILANDSKVTKKAVDASKTLHVYTHYSRTLASMFNTFMKLSNNSMADNFTRAVGAQIRHQGNLNSGLNVMRSYLASIDVNSKGLTLYDGSGLSSKNKVSTNTISQLLYEVQKEPTFNTFYQSLPVGGNSNRLIGGTLKNRFTGSSYAGRVIAKTGHIDGVYSLSGYVKTKKGNTFVFSILTENQSSSSITKIDKIVKTVIDFY